MNTGKDPEWLLDPPAIPMPSSIRENTKPLATITPGSKQVDIQPQTTQAISIFNRNADISPFLRLPAELRLKLYELAVGYQLIHVLHSSENEQEERVYDDDEMKSVVHLAGKNAFDLLRCSRQIYGEAFEVVWSTNTFVFDRSCDLSYFMGALQPYQFDSVRNLQVIGYQYQGFGKTSWWQDGWEIARDSLVSRPFRNLRNLQVSVRTHRSYERCKDIPMDFLAELAELVLGQGQVSVEAVLMEGQPGLLGGYAHPVGLRCSAIASCKEEFRHLLALNNRRVGACLGRMKIAGFTLDADLW